MIKKIIAFVTVLIFMIPMYARAESAPKPILDGVEAQCVYVCEINTGTKISAKNENKSVPMGHFSKLMTVLLCAEDMKQGKVKLNDKVTVSANANSKQGTQIWLDAGEKISVEELLKSVIIGNANDACTALGEYISGSEEKHIARMNKRAEQLGMINTHFKDICGMDKNTVSTAKDIAVLSSSLVKHDNLSDYFTTWIDSVRCKAVELVSTNRLVRTCKGLKLGKACTIPDVGESAVECVTRGDMSVCAVLIGDKSDDTKFTNARNILDRCFEQFRVFSPDIDKKYLKKITVINGEDLKVPVKIDNFNQALIKAGTLGDVKATVSVEESVKAPVKKGQVLGKIRYEYDGKTLLIVKICANKDVKTMNFACALRKSLANMLNF